MVRRMVFTGGLHTSELLISNQSSTRPFLQLTGYWYEYVAA
jgi:hypothetical protein